MRQVGLPWRKEKEEYSDLGRKQEPREKVHLQDYFSFCGGMGCHGKIKV